MAGKSVDVVGASQLKTVFELLEDQRLSNIAAAAEAKARTDALGGVRQVAISADYVELSDTTEKRLIPDIHVTPNGYELEVVQLLGVE